MGDGLMAKMTIKGIDEYAAKLSELGAASVEISKKVVMAGANPVADEIRKNLIANLNDPGYVGKRDVGTKTTVPTGIS